MACPLCDKVAFVHELPADELVWEFPHSIAFLGPWQYYTGYCVLVARSHATELHHLRADIRAAFFDEMIQLSRAIEQAFHRAS
jgi:diadenosine tetraphosphate (Ap4A) HIT family hydrolase